MLLLLLEVDDLNLRRRSRVVMLNKSSDAGNDDGADDDDNDDDDDGDGDGDGDDDDDDDDVHRHRHRHRHHDVLSACECLRARVWALQVGLKAKTQRSLRLPRTSFPTWAVAVEPNTPEGLPFELYPGRLVFVCVCVCVDLENR